MQFYVTRYGFKINENRIIIIIHPMLRMKIDHCFNRLIYNSPLARMILENQQITVGGFSFATMIFAHLPLAPVPATL